MFNPMKLNPMQLVQQLNQFRQGITGNPQQIVMDAVRGGRISQEQLNRAQQVAAQIQSMLRGVN